MTVETLAVSVFVARDREKKKTLHKYILHNSDADEAGDEIKRYSMKSYWVLNIFIYWLDSYTFIYKMSILPLVLLAKY